MAAVGCFLLLLCASTWLALGFCRDVQRVAERYVPDYEHYHNVSSLIRFLGSFSAAHEGFVRLDDSYMSRLANPVFVLRLTNFSASEKRKIKILFSYGEHAREFFPVESMLHFLKKTLQEAKNEKSAKSASFVLDNFDVFIVPMLNPDGRLYVEKTNNYCWRGTATGVDVNRNFDWCFGGVGSSNDSRDEEYRGLYPFSEPEAQLLRNVAIRHSFDAFVSFHSGIKQIYVPFSDSLSRKMKRRHHNEEEELRLAAAMASAAGAQFSYGVGYELSSYPADGASFDYMAGKRNMPFSLAVELWGSDKEDSDDDDTCFDLFNPTSTGLQGELEGVFPMYDAFFHFLFDWKMKQRFLKDPLPHMAEPLDSELEISAFQIAYFIAAVILVAMTLRKVYRSLRRKNRIIRLSSLGDSLG